MNAWWGVLVFIGIASVLLAIVGSSLPESLDHLIPVAAVTIVVVSGLWAMALNRRRRGR
ncbi:hypothetical protein [Microbacterium xanthum]|uniref:hypothetical protein n=1 Tax=Microbacterium xanthum TaxID=3079794 RepID=UPI002AD2DB4E|nr:MULTISPECIES: hypothetical protein [unclassified Microbacterium]MDZ8172693.1 hypothetical protein [Microbacterium sp. KSW-48]MDZ8202470.1 hypothetical protein [Microbacterium sp. SSW1-59]